MIYLFLFLASLSPLAESPFEPWGKDSDLTKTPSTTSPPQSHIGVKPCVAMIRFFQNYISPIDGPRSHFTPSSSQYTLLAIQQWGVFKGIALGCDRLLRENKSPWLYPTHDDKKVDPVPRK